MPLDDASIPDAPAALQFRRAHGLVPYPTGKSAMVYYAYAATSARDAVTAFAARDDVGAHAPVLVRWIQGERARGVLEELYEGFIARFGRAPVLNDDG